MDVSSSMRAVRVRNLSRRRATVAQATPPQLGPSESVGTIEQAGSVREQASSNSRSRASAYGGAPGAPHGAHLLDETV